MRIDRERMIVEALQVVSRTLQRGNAPKLERKNPFRLPTKKELGKYPKLLRKQRRLSIGES